MRLPAALLLAFITVPALAQSAELGLAESRSGLWCLATGAEKIAPGTELLLYEPYQGIRASARVAQGAGEGCGELKSRFIWPRQPDAPAFFYRIEPQDPKSIEALAGAGALFAVLDAPEAAPGRGIDLDGDGTPERFRICTSGEGLHFVVEGGEAVLWHAYYHLGLDVEPDCPDRIYAE
ncbi:MAG: hypothetical protein K0S81_1308 [Rhodospirillales bacterium]|jgi:hypothetical protein|nr:hypothetical protein [Rhodospirillales bacterium]